MSIPVIILNTIWGCIIAYNIFVAVVDLNYYDDQLRKGLAWSKDLDYVRGKLHLKLMKHLACILVATIIIVV